MIGKTLLLTSYLLVVCAWLTTGPVQGQRSLLHWQRDLEYRIKSYLDQRSAIDNILASSINSAREAASSEAKVISGANVRFSDLIVPKGSILLDRHVARPTVRILVNKTQVYVQSKMNELYQIRSRLDEIKRQIARPGQHFIYKGLPNMPIHMVNYTRVTGTRVFKQFIYGHFIKSDQVDLAQINRTRVDNVLRDTYMENKGDLATDSHSRLFFEGTKTFYRTVFSNQLKSGCCDRLRPLHTNRMMTRNGTQEILAPVMFQTNNRHNLEPVVIRHLSTNRLVNRILAVGMFNAPGHNGLLPSPTENAIQRFNLIDIRGNNVEEIRKTLIFRNNLMVNDAQLSYDASNMRSSIGIDSVPGLQLDLSHDNYLLKYINSRNNVTQRIDGRMFINSEALFRGNLDAGQVNTLPRFAQFLQTNVVRIDRPADIFGKVQFNALPTMLSPIGLSRPPHNVLIMRVDRQLEVSLLNGMRIPLDIHIIPSGPPPSPIMSLPPIKVYGPRHFVNNVRFNKFLQVDQLVNGLQMPEGVIPLHLNDFMGSVGASNLLFLDGIEAQHVTVHSGHFDDLKLSEVYGDAQSLIMRSLIARKPDGTQVIRAPLRIMNLRLLKDPVTNRGGMLNGFRPDSILEFNRRATESIHGKKTFLAHVEAGDCVFSDINNMADWINHLIRIDRPNMIQTVHSKLAFVSGPVPTSVRVDRLNIEFDPHNSPEHYLYNFNFSPELFFLHQALVKSTHNHTGGRYRVEQVVFMDPNRSRINGIYLNDIVTLDKPMNFLKVPFTFVGKVDVKGTLRAGRVSSNYPIDTMDLVQFNQYRIPITGSLAPIHLNRLVLSTNNQAAYVRTKLLNGVPFNEFANSIMSLTRPQTVYSNILLASPVNLEGLVKTESSLNGIAKFNQFASTFKRMSYALEDGLQCNSVVIKS